MQSRDSPADPSPTTAADPPLRARPSETVPHDPEITEQEVRVPRVEQSRAVMVAEDGLDGIVGTRDLRPSSLYLGAHVANAGDVDALVMVQHLVEEAGP